MAQRVSRRPDLEFGDWSAHDTLQIQEVSLMSVRMMPKPSATGRVTAARMRGEMMKIYGEKSIELAQGVVAHPHIMSGAPRITNRSIGTEWLSNRFLAGDSVKSLADDYEVSAKDIENAIRYEFRRRKERRPEFRASCSCHAQSAVK